MTAVGRAPAPVGRRAPERVLAVCCLSLVLVVLAVSSLNIAVPQLQAGLGASPSELLWIVDAYALVFAGTLLPAGALGDRFGRKGALLVGLGLFGAGAAGASLSGTTAQVVGARAVMGLGAGFVMPATLSIISTVFEPERRPRAIAVWVGFAGAGGALGPIVSGLVLEWWSWPAVFLITVPVAAVTAAAVAVEVPRIGTERSRLDPVGALLSVVGLFGLLFAIIEAPEKGWTSAPVAVGFVAAGAMLAGFVAWELRHDDPMLDPRYFRMPGFMSGAATITLVFFVMFGMFFLLPQFLQFVQDRSPLDAAVRLLPSGLTLILVAPRGPALAARIGSAASSGLGLAAAAAGFVLLSQLEADTAYLWVAAALVLMAAGSALTMPPATSAIVGSMPPAKAGVGSAVNDVTREVGGALGIAAIGSIASVIYRHEVAHSTGRLDPGTEAAIEDSIGSAVAASAAGPGAEAFEAAQAAFSTAVGSVFALCAALMSLGASYYVRQHLAHRRAAARTGVGEAPCSVPCAR